MMLFDRLFFVMNVLIWGAVEVIILELHTYHGDTSHFFGIGISR